MNGLILAIVLAIAHYYSEEFVELFSKKLSKMLSFSAGIAISYIILYLLPKFTYTAFKQSHYMFLAVLTGFVMFYIVDKWIYKHAPKSKLRKELALEDSLVSFVYHFFVGAILVSLVQLSLVETLFFFFPVVFFTAASALPFQVPPSKKMQWILASSTIIGAIFAMSFFINAIIYNAMMGLVIGMMFFTTTRHTMPKGPKGYPMYFFLGTCVYSALVVLFLY